MSRYDARFADYVTRVSFNLTLSKEMVTALAHIDHELRMVAHWGYPRLHATVGIKDEIHAHRFPRQPGWIVGLRGLQNRGLVTWEDPGEMEPKWSRYPFAFTPAGEHVVALLKIAGLIHERPVAANEGEKPKRRVRAEMRRTG